MRALGHWAGPPLPPPLSPPPPLAPPPPTDAAAVDLYTGDVDRGFFAFTSVTRSIGGTGDGVDFGRFFVELRGMVAAVEEPECFFSGRPR